MLIKLYEINAVRMYSMTLLLVEIITGNLNGSNQLAATIPRTQLYRTQISLRVSCYNLPTSSSLLLQFLREQLIISI